MNARDFQTGLEGYQQKFEPKKKFQPVKLGNNAGTIAVSGDSSKVWVRTEDGQEIRVDKGTLSSATPVNTPLLIGDMSGGTSSAPQVQGVHVEQIDSASYVGQNFMGSYLGLAGQIAYAGADRNATSNAALSWSGLQLRIIQDVSASIRIDAYDDANSPFIFMRRARGTQASHAATQADDILMALWGTGHATTDVVATNKAALEFAATQTWSDTAMGTKLNFYTTPDSTTTRALAAVIDQDGALRPQKGFAYTSQITPSQITANQNDYAPTGYATAVRFRLDSDAARTITGISSTGVSTGDIKILDNIGAFTITLADASASSSAANRFEFAADIPLRTMTSLTIVYDGTSSRWRAVGAAGANGAPPGGAGVAGAANRVAYWLDASTLTHSANMTFVSNSLNLNAGVLNMFRADADAVFTATSGAGASYFAAGLSIYHDTGTPSLRWQLAKTGDSTGDFAFARFNDSGSFQDIPLQIERSTGSLYLSPTGNVTIGGGGFGSSLAKGLTLGDGTAPSTSITGSQTWSESNGLKWMKSGVAVEMGVPGNLTGNVTDVGNVGAGEDDLMTYSVAASTLSTNLDWIEFYCVATFAANANSKRVKAKFGATTVYDSGAQNQNGGSMHLHVKVIRTGAATQDASAAMNASTGSLYGVADHQYTTPGETLSGAVTFKLTGEAVNNDDIVQKILLVRHNPTP